MPEERVHTRMVDAWRELLEERVDAGHLRPAMGGHDLAYHLVRTGESVLYSDLLAGRPPDARVAATVQRALLAVNPDAGRAAL